VQSAALSRSCLFLYRLICWYACLSCACIKYFFLSFSLSTELADTSAWELFGIPADTLSDLTFTYPLSIAGQIYWHAWFTFWNLANGAFRFQCVDFCINNRHKCQELQIWLPEIYISHCEWHNQERHNLPSLIQVYASWWLAHSL